MATIEQFPPSETVSQRIAKKLLEQYPRGTREHEKLVEDLAWFYNIREDLASNDAQEYARGMREKADDTSGRFERLLTTEYGELTLTELHDLVHHLKEGADSFPTVRKRFELKRAA